MTLKARFNAVFRTVDTILLSRKIIEGGRAAPSASPLQVGQVLEFHFENFRPRITIRSARELRVDVMEGNYSGFSDTVEYEAVPIREDLVMLSWQEHNGSTVVHMLDLGSRTTYTAVTPADGGFVRMSGRIEVSSEA